MFPARFQIGFLPSWPGRPDPGAGTGRESWSGAFLRVAGVPPHQALGHPSGASAQALGTMQVTATVLPADAGWRALSEARGAARRLLQTPWTSRATRAAGLVQARAELASVDGRRRLLVTIHYPRN
jgi:hypothetical protein